MAITCCELKWLRYLLCDLRVPISRPIPLFCDNQAALHCLQFGLSWAHQDIKIDCHFIRINYKSTILFLHISLPLSNLRTYPPKPLTFLSSIFLLVKLSVRDLHAPTWGEGVEDIEDIVIKDAENIVNIHTITQSQWLLITEISFIVHFFTCFL